MRWIYFYISFWLYFASTSVLWFLTGYYPSGVFSTILWASGEQNLRVLLIFASFVQYGKASRTQWVLNRSVLAMCQALVLGSSQEDTHDAYILRVIHQMETYLVLVAWVLTQLFHLLAVWSWAKLLHFSRSHLL